MSSRKAGSSRPKRTKVVSTIRLESPSIIGPPPAKKQKTKPLSSIPRHHVFALTPSQAELLVSTSETESVKSKGKAKARAEVPSTKASGHGDSVLDGRLWVDIYEPIAEEDLAVHKRKVQDVRQWMIDAFDGGPTGKLRKYRRILVLTGPAGTAKTTTLRVLARELDIEILEWNNSLDDRFRNDHDYSEGTGGGELEYESVADRFQAFLARASTCCSVFSTASLDSSLPLQGSKVAPFHTAMQTSSLPASTPQAMLQPLAKRQLILLKDLPNILHPSTQAAFHATLEAFAFSPVQVSPMVIIISDAGLRGEDAEDVLGGDGWRRTKEAFDIRTVLQPSLLNSPYVTHISFRPIAPTYLRSALQRILDQHFRSGSSSSQSKSRRAAPAPWKDMLNLVIESSNGDIRSAVMALQFACVSYVNNPSYGNGTRKGAGLPAEVLVEAVTRREQSLALFHLLGKLLFNKRKGDPPAPSASAKDIKRDQDIDAQLLDPPRLPPHLQEHERRASRVDLESLYADTPVDASLLSLYIHQNYTQYCDQLEECDAEADWLSYIDASGGETWRHANPHHFHLLSLSTLHSLPSPVTRRNQKPFKPAFFEALQHERQAEDGIRDVQEWLLKREEFLARSWSRQDIALELGAVLKARDAVGIQSYRAPKTHCLFSKLDFTQKGVGLEQLTEDADVPDDDVSGADDAAEFGTGASELLTKREGGGCLSDDDIEDF
ncbi:Rad17-domain-containing protein [Wolfiporia cocos MD-104 SS10]|uniref:Rad17-domain-containing protein n=1 Tax=Wolfiporia cocos (strain MD-104) TaxID=742152 RepID=A0A2H3JKC3_WOLCO|nr:Rad17-domain-containing protein [Wolfiporia cocos MD-104 SS10]